MPKKEKKPPTAEEIAEMLGVAAEKTFKVEQDHIPKVRLFPSRPTAPLLRRSRQRQLQAGGAAPLPAAADARGAVGRRRRRRSA